jgi:hypothetical protein
MMNLFHTWHTDFEQIRGSLVDVLQEIILVFTNWKNEKT